MYMSKIYLQQMLLKIWIRHDTVQISIRKRWSRQSEINRARACGRSHQCINAGRCGRHRICGRRREWRPDTGLGKAPITCETYSYISVDEPLTKFHLRSEPPLLHYNPKGKARLPCRDSELARPRSRRAGPQRPPHRLHLQSLCWQVAPAIGQRFPEMLKRRVAGVDGVHHRQLREAGRH